MDNFKKHIEQFLIDHPEPQVQTFKAFLWQLFGQKEEQPILYPTNTFTAPKLFRIRPYTDLDLANHISYHSFPDKNISKSGRTNIKGYPVFYGTFHPATGIKEIIKHKTTVSRFFVSKWTIKNSLNFAPIIPTQFLKDAHQIFAQFDEKTKDTLQFFSSFLGDQIMSENYNLSSIISHILLYENNIDAISYPSAIDLSGVNFSIHPRVREKNDLDLRLIYDVEYNKETNRIALNRIGIYRKNDVIEWQTMDQLIRYHEFLDEFKVDFS
jgi:hypothetical protein